MGSIAVRVRHVGTVDFWADPSRLVKASHARHLVSIVKASWNRNRTGPVLDCGCGVGVLSQILAGEGLMTIGIDISVEQIRLAHARTKGSTFLVADATSLPFRDCSFSAVVFHSVLTYAAIEKALLEAWRTLHWNGVLTMCEFNSTNLWVRIHRGWGSREIFTREQYRRMLVKTEFSVRLCVGVDYFPTRLRVLLPVRGRIGSLLEKMDIWLSQLEAMGPLGGFILAAAEKEK